MILTRGVQRALLASFSALLAAVYLVAWLAPGIGLYHDDADYLVTSSALAEGHGYSVDSSPVSIPQTKFPPLFPTLLALSTLVSRQPQWLKLLPLACSAGWLILLRKLLLEMGASSNAALLLAGLTAASPAVISLSTNLFPDPLFALLLTAALLALLKERFATAGAFAGLATLTQSAGASLIVACILTLVARRRFRGAVVFAAVGMLIAAPWFGWSFAHVTAETLNTSSNPVSSNILASLAANEKLVVLSRNFLLLLISPFSLMAGIRTTYCAIATLLILGWSLFVRRQFVPDLFLALYSIVLLFRIWPPERSVAPVLPLILWMVWRAFRLIAIREALAAAVLISVLVPLAVDFAHIPRTIANGYFQQDGPAIDNWSEMEKLFAFIRSNTSQGSILAGNLDPVLYLNTGRRAVRGFVPEGFSLFYAPRPSAVTPDQLATAISQSRASYLVLTPDRGLAESASFHRSAEALERGGVLEPVSIPGAAPGYRLLLVTR